MSVSRRSAHINVMVDAAEKAGRRLVRDFGEVENLQVSKKGPGDFVSNADTKAEKIIMETLQKARPRYGFLMEEGGEIKGEDSDCRFIIDPLDGTTNFLHGMPHWCISIGLEKKGEMVAGVVYDAIKDELFWADKGLGAYLNNRRLRVSARKKMSDAVVCVGRETNAAFAQEIDKLQGQCSGIRRTGSAALDLCYVAAGRFDAYWERIVYPWDVAAGAMIAKEAGGTIEDMDGGKNYVFGGGIIATNTLLHRDITSIIRPAQKTTKSAS